MIINRSKFEIVLARQQKVVADLRCLMSQQTLTRIGKEQNVTTKTADKIAHALSVDVTELIEEA